MKKKLLFFLFIIITWRCIAQSNNTLIPESVIYNFLSKSQLLENLSPKIIYKHAKVYPLNKLKLVTQRLKSECGIFYNIKNLLSHSFNDSTFIYAQLSDSSEFIWKKEYISGEWEIIDNNFNESDDNTSHEGFYIISRPLFSINYELALVNIIFIQGNYAKGSYYVYKKEGEKYVVVKEFCKWRS